MTLNELRQLCREGDYVLLRLPLPNSQGYTRRLCGRYGPRGEVINGHPDRGQTVRFLSSQILRYVDKIERDLETEGE